MSSTRPVTADPTLNDEPTTQPGVLAVAAWTLHDLARTIYSAAIISVYFPAFVKDDLKINDIWYAFPAAVAALLVAFVSPLIGRISDRGGHRMSWLLWSTLLSVAALFLMGFFPVAGIVIALFVVANAAFQVGAMFYDSLLPSVSTPKNWGKVGGLGVGLGYLGGITGFLVVPLLTGMIFGKNERGGTINSATFLVTAVLYLVIALPCFFLVREKRFTARQDDRPITVRDTFGQLWQTLQDSRQYAGLLIFLVSNFFYSDALNTVIVAMGIYSTKAIGLDEGGRNGFLAFSTIFAIIGAIIFGYVTDRIGPKRSLNIALSLWVLVFLFALVLPSVANLTHDDKLVGGFFFWLGGPLAGIALGSVWVGARTLMIELTPPDRLGEFMGIYNLTGKCSAVLGPLVWGIMLFLFDPESGWGKTGYQIAVGALFGLIVIGFVLHQRVPYISRKARGEQYIEAEKLAA